MSARRDSERGRGERDRNEERRVPRGNIHQVYEREEGCLSGWLTGIMMAAVLDPFLLERRPIRISITGRVGRGKGRSLTDCAAHPILGSTSAPFSPPVWLQLP